MPPALQKKKKLKAKPKLKPERNSLFVRLLSSTFRTLCLSATLYFLFLGLLTIPLLQDHAIYLHSVTLTGNQDVTVAEQWGFLPNQVTPFTLETPDRITLHAWHILPLGIYHKHQQELTREPEDLLENTAGRTSFKLLRDDPEALLVLYLHGAAGTLASGWRPPSYRAMSALAPDKIHTVAIDYRGFGSSSGAPSEQGLLTDAITLAEWAMQEAGIPPSRIVIFGQSLGTAVGISLAEYYATGPNPMLFAGLVLVAPFADVELLTSSYRIAGIVPILGPLAPFPRLLAFFNTFIISEWRSKERLATFVRQCKDMLGAGLKYHITIIHAQDDYDIPWSHSDQLFWHAVNASQPNGIVFEDLEREKTQSKKNLGSAGWVAEHRTSKGVVREEITKWGLHDKIMSYPIVSLAVLRAFERG